METPALRSFRQEFAKRAEWRREDERRYIDRIKADEKEKKREKEQERQDEALMDWALAELASQADIAAFTVKLDKHDAATVEALMENEKALERVREELWIMLDKAYVLPDGRRVFKTEDGTRVFDEHGQEVTDFDAQQIEEWRPKWEEMNKSIEKRDALENERRELIEYQDRLDKIREEADKDGLTKDELEKLEKRLEEGTPEAVKRQLNRDEENAPRHERNGEPEQPVFRTGAKLDMPAL